MNRFHTRVIPVDLNCTDSRVLKEAGEIIKSGELVAFPTETVYGLGANALDASAVEKIFIAKGRPSNNPLIVHVATVEAAKQLTSSWPKIADDLAAVFWPGPLTLILNKAAKIPDIVTAGGSTVGIRIPAHPVAISLIQAAEVPIAAPSANQSEQLSPTRASHVLKSLDGKIGLILDGGPASGGLESTVLDLSKEIPRILRPGLITPQQIEKVIGELQRSKNDRHDDHSASLPSPGMLLRHYAPQAKLEIRISSSLDRVVELINAGKRVGWLTFNQNHQAVYGSDIISMPLFPEEYARKLFASLHDLDARECEYIIVDAPPDGEGWDAIRDRISRAAYIRE